MMSRFENWVYWWTTAWLWAVLKIVFIDKRLPDDEPFLGMHHLVIANVQVLEDGDVPAVQRWPFVYEYVHCDLSLCVHC